MTLHWSKVLDKYDKSWNINSIDRLLSTPTHILMHKSSLSILCESLESPSIPSSLLSGITDQKAPLGWWGEAAAAERVKLKITDCGCSQSEYTVKSDFPTRLSSSSSSSLLALLSLAIPASQPSRKARAQQINTPTGWCGWTRRP